MGWTHRRITGDGLSRDSVCQRCFLEVIHATAPQGLTKRDRAARTASSSMF